MKFMTANNKKTETEKLKSEVERLKKELKKKKKYGLVWEDKTEDVVEMCKEKLPVLKEVKNKEIITDKNKPINLLIEGDNYHALSVLNYTHKGKIDVIYIDPPYNTGKQHEWKFNDMWVDNEDSYKHSKWLSFMEKRLKLAKNLLKNTGVIFISIDDNEVGQLKVLCDEIFGEKRFIGVIHWRKNRKPHNAGGTLSKSAEFILVYSGVESIKLVREYTIKDSDENGDYSEGPIFKADKKVREYIFPKGIVCQTPEIQKGINTSARNPKLYIEYLDKPIIKNGILQNNVKIKGRYCLTDERGRLSEEIKMGNIFINSNGVPKCRVYREELLGKVANNLWVDKGFNEDAHEEIRNIFNVDLASEIFDYPKPTKLIKEILKSTDKKEAIVLDFFAGSGTTGQAVLELNKDDGGTRKFILNTNNEDNNGTGYKIAEDICHSRIKKIINGYKDLKGNKVNGLAGNLKYFKTDFVDYTLPTDRNKIKLTREATEMLCVKEGTFEKVFDEKNFKIFKNSEHYTGIIFDQSAIPAFKKVITDIKGKLSIYVFSLGDDDFADEFSGLKQKVVISPIPEAILKVYRRIYK